MKIILVNAYPMDNAYKLWQQGLYPGHHLWGILELQKKEGFECIILPHQKYKFLNKLGKYLNIQFLDQQIRALWLLRKCDAIYAPYAAENTKLIVILKLLGLVKKQVVIVVHQPLFGFNSKNKIKNYIVKKLSLQYDSIIFLSERLRSDLIDTLNVSKEISDRKFKHLNWGPEEIFYKNYSIPKNPEETKFVISAGHTSRDYDTLIDAFRVINFPLKIYCTPASIPKTKVIPSNVEIIANDKHISYFDLLKEYNNARILLIPVTVNPGTQGLTSLLDVLAMGKPVIMTENSNIDLDIDEEGIGKTVRQGNVDDWVNTLNLLLNDFNLLKQMGQKSLELMHEKFNMALYTDGLAKIFLDNYTRENQ
jgi:glycosyltransferase involved in cell wall biosynthesis